MSKKIKISCKEASFLISKKQETKLSFYEKLQLMLHLFICDTCTLFLKQTNYIIQLLSKKNKPQQTLSSEAKNKMQEELSKEMK